MVSTVILHPGAGGFAPAVGLRCTTILRIHQGLPDRAGRPRMSRYRASFRRRFCTDAPLLQERGM